MDLLLFETTYWHIVQPILMYYICTTLVLYNNIDPNALLYYIPIRML